MDARERQTRKTPPAMKMLAASQIGSGEFRWRWRDCKFVVRKGWLVLIWGEEVGVGGTGVSTVTVTHLAR